MGICGIDAREGIAMGKMEAFDPPQEFFISMMACQVNHAINIALYCFSGESGCVLLWGEIIGVAMACQIDHASLVGGG